MTSSKFKDYLGSGLDADLPTASDIDPTPGAGVFYYATDTQKLYAQDAAGTGWDYINAGGGGGSVSSMCELVYQYISDNPVTLSPGQSFDFVLTQGNMVAMYHTRYANGTTYYGATSSFTVPTGKVANLVAAYPTNNTQSDPTYNKNRLQNDTTSTVIVSAADFLISRNGFVNADTNTTASATYDPRVQAGVAGDVLRVYAGGGPDSVSRATTCFYILVIADP